MDDPVSSHSDFEGSWAPVGREPGADPAQSPLQPVADALDPVLVPMGFASGQLGNNADEGQVIFCRGFDPDDEFDDGCIDLVINLRADPSWRIVDVRYWGFTSDRWRLDFDRSAPLPDQLSQLARTLPNQLEPEPPDGR